MTNTLGLADEEFWTNPLKRPEAKPPVGLVLAAPEMIPLRGRDTFPAVVRRTGLVADHALAPFQRYGIVTAVDLGRNEIYANHALNVEGAIWIQPKPASAYVGNSSAPYVLELRDRLGLPWRAAEYLVTVIIRDQISNRALVRITAEPPGTYEDPEVRRYLESLRAPQARARRSDTWPPPAAPLPAYGRLPDAPAVPEGEGIVLGIDRVVVCRSGARAVLRGSFRLKASEAELVAATDAPDSAAAPTAIVPIHLVATGSDDATPLTVTLRVPSFDPVAPGATSAVVTGHFAVDVFPLLNIGAAAQTFFVYAFSRALMVGPAVLGLITPDMLPPGAT